MIWRKYRSLSEQPSSFGRFGPPQQLGDLLQSRRLCQHCGVLAAIIEMTVMDQGQAGFEHGTAPMQPARSGLGGIAASFLPLQQPINVLPEVAVLPRSLR